MLSAKCQPFCWRLNVLINVGCCTMLSFPRDGVGFPSLLLTHWGRDKIATIFWTTFSNAFSWMKMYEFPLKFVPKGPINNIPALVQIMTWRQSGDKPLSEPMMVNLLTYICVILPQWVNTFAPGRYGSNLKVWFSNLLYRIIAQTLTMKLLLRWMLQNLTNEEVNIGSGTAIRQQAITWVSVEFVNPDFCCHIAPLCHNELTHWASWGRIIIADILQTLGVKWYLIVPFHKDFSRSGKQLEHRKLAHDL